MNGEEGIHLAFFEGGLFPACSSQPLKEEVLIGVGRALPGKSACKVNELSKEIMTVLKSLVL